MVQATTIEQNGLARASMADDKLIHDTAGRAVPVLGVATHFSKLASLENQVVEPSDDGGEADDEGRGRRQAAARRQVGIDEQVAANVKLVSCAQCA